MRRILMVTILLISLIITALPCYGSASENNTPNEAYEVTVDDDKLLEKLEALGVIEIKDYDLNDFITRRQMAEIVVKLVNLPRAQEGEGKQPFLDVSIFDESVGAISALYESGIIKGNEKLEFRPDDLLTYNEAFVFFVNALGYEVFATNKGGYPTGYCSIANDLKLTQGIKVGAWNENVTVRNVYIMLEAALDAGDVEIEWKEDGSPYYSISSENNFLNKKYHIRKNIGIVTGSEHTYIDSADAAMTDEQIAIDNVIYDTPGYVYADMLGRCVYYYLRESSQGETEIAYIEEAERYNKVVKVNAEDILKGKTTITSIYYQDNNNKEKRIRFGNNVDVIYNGRYYKGYGYLEKVIPDVGYIEALDNNGDGIYELLFVNSYRNIIVESIDTYNNIIVAKKTNEKIKADVSDKDITIYKMPEKRKIDLGSVKIGDVASIMESKGDPQKTDIYITRNTIEGMITTINAEDGYCIDEVFYKMANEYYGPELKSGMEVKLELDMNGDIVNASADSAEKEGLAVLTKVFYDDAGEELNVKVFTQSGEEKTYLISFPVKINDVRYKQSDCEKAYAELSKNNVGEQYQLKKPYVIQYSTNDVGIREIQTGNSKDSGKLHIISEGTSFFVRNQKMIGVGDGPSSYVTYKNGQTVIFCVPEEEKIKDTEYYKVIPELSTDRQYVTNPTQYYQNKIDDFVMYDFNNNTTNIAEVILLRGYSGSAALSNSNSICVITGINEVMNQQNEITREFCMNGSEKVQLAQKFILEKENQTLTLNAMDDLSSYFKAGTIIRYNTDIQGMLSNVQVLGEYDSESKELYQYFTNSVPGSINYLLINGVVKNNDIKNGVLTYTTSDDNGAMEYMLNAEEPRVMMYESENKTVHDAEITTLAPGDNILVRATDYYKVEEIIVFK